MTLTFEEKFLERKKKNARRAIQRNHKLTKNIKRDKRKGKKKIKTKKIRWDEKKKVEK